MNLQRRSRVRPLKQNRIVQPVFSLIKPHNVNTVTMDKPKALVELLEELKESVTDSTVETVNGSGALIYLPSEAKPLHLTQEEAELLFHSPQTVEQLYQALGSPDDIAVELHDLGIDDAVQDCLDRLFTAVDAY